jgi:hypothetical protein
LNVIPFILDQCLKMLAQQIAAKGTANKRHVRRLTCKKLSRNGRGQVAQLVRSFLEYPVGFSISSSCGVVHKARVSGDNVTRKLRRIKAMQQFSGIRGVRDIQQ